MLNKTNITIGVLAVVALVSSLSFLNIVGAINLRSNLTSILGTSSLAPIENDLDGDGLLNSEESYWRTDFMNPDTDGDGFLDGEEVKSGHDPLIPGPDDLLPEPGNLTEKLSNLSVSGLYEGSLKKDSPNYEISINQLASLIVDDGLKEISDTEAVNEVKYIPRTEISERIYLRDLFLESKRFLDIYLLELRELDQKLDIIGNYGWSDDDVSSYFKQKTQEMDSVINSILKIKVPENWKNEHESLLRSMLEIRNSNSAIAAGSKDPVKSVIGMVKAVSSFDPFIAALIGYELKMESLSIDPNLLAF